MKNENIKRIKAESSLIPYIESLGILIHKDNKFLCPFHDDHNPSASVYEKDGVQYWKCFVCDKGGDVIDFVARKENCTKNEAIKLLDKHKKPNKKTNDNLSINVIKLKQALLAKIKNEGVDFLKEFFQKYEANNKTITEYLGWDNYHNSIVILINNSTTKTHHKKGMSGKWIVPKGCTSINPFPINHFNSSNKLRSFICEGEKDTLNLILNGFTAITLGSATGDWSKYKDILIDCGEIILVYDNDKAGEKGRDKAIKSLSSLNIPMKYIDFSKLPIPIKKGYDVSDFLSEHNPSELLSNQICFEVNSEKALNTEFEKELSQLNICVYYDENKRQYVIIDNKTNRILYSGNKQFIQQTLSSLFKRTIKPKEYSEFPLCHTFYDPSNKLPALKPNVKPINVYQKPLFKISPNPINSIPLKIKILLNNLFQVNAQLDYFINWLACFLQTGEKSQTAIVLISGQGVGKGTFARIIEILFGEDNCIEVTNSMIESDFNDYMDHKQILVFNEITTVSDLNSRKQMKNKLKSLITDLMIRLNPKGLPAFSAKNVFNIFMTTNEPHPIDVEEDDRRFTVIKSNGVPLNIAMGIEYTEYWPLIMAETPEFHQYLMSYKCDFKKYNTPLETEHKDKLKSMSQTFDDRFALAIAKNNFSYFEKLLPDTIKNDGEDYDKEVVIQEYKECIKKEFISNELVCSLYRGIKGVDFKNQPIKGRLVSTGIFDTYRIEDIQINLQGKTTRGLKLNKEIII